MYPQATAYSLAEQAPRRAPRGALDNIANKVSTTHRNNRFALRNNLRAITDVPRVRGCGLALASNVGFVYMMRDAHGTVRYHGLETCRRIWLCPVCGPRISAERARILEFQIAGWQAKDAVVLFLTLTFPHDYADPLLLSAKTAAKGFTAVLSGRPWQDDKAHFKIAGTVRALEVTLGTHGWHPHLHVLIFAERYLGVRARRGLQASLVQRFTKRIVSAGFRTPDIRNCPLESVSSSEVGQYVAKINSPAHELTSWQLKRGRGDSRSPVQLLEDLIESESEEDLRRYREWETGMHRRRQLTYSRGLRTVLGHPPKIDPDALAEQEIRRVLLSETVGISPKLWEIITKTGGLEGVLRNDFRTGGYSGAFKCLQEKLGPEVTPGYLRNNLLDFSTPTGQCDSPKC